MSQLHQHLIQRLRDVLQLTPEQDNLLLLNPPKNPDHGDMALGCFQVAKARKAAPPAVAQEIAEAIGNDEVIESAVATGPFVNFRFSRAALAKEVVEGVLRSEAPYGATPEAGDTVVIDFSSPNIAKPFHMGHLRSTVIGAALTRMHRHVGHRVEGVNHLGDWGMPFAKVMTAWIRYGDEAELEARPMRHMFELYVRYGKEAKENPGLDEEAARHFQALESGEDNDERRMWKLLRDKSLEAFQGPYSRLGVTFDHFTGESFYEDKVEDAMQRVVDAGVLEKDQGADVVDLKPLGIKVPCLLRKSDGTTLYHTRDLAAVFYRDETFAPARILYVVGAEQKLHFQQLKGVLKRMELPSADKVEHVPFGLILAKNEETGKWEKFASRGGNAIFLDEVLDEAVRNVRRIIQDKNPDLEGADEVAEAVGVGAIVFQDLRNSRIKDVKFDWDGMLNFDGETGPYVQYAGARLESILRKAGVAEGDRDTLLDGVDFAQLADAAPVLLTMQRFDAAVNRAVADSEPSVVTNFTIDLAGSIHSYLRDHHVLGAEEPIRNARLALVAAARQLIRTGLALVGVRSPDAM